MIRFGKIRSHDEAVTGIFSHSPLHPISNHKKKRIRTKYSQVKRFGSFGKQTASRKEKERTIMSNNSSNKLNVPQAKQGMEQFKMLTRQ